MDTPAVCTCIEPSCKNGLVWSQDSNSTLSHPHHDCLKCRKLYIASVCAGLAQFVKSLTANQPLAWLTFVFCATIFTTRSFHPHSVLSAKVVTLRSSKFKKLFPEYRVLLFPSQKLVFIGS